MVRVVWSLALTFLGSAAMLADASAQTRAVIELFTSQGCSSCPPADQLVGELARDPSIVAISMPIDYWDYLGWTDTLASPGNSARQRGYARSRGDREIYTPQAVVNGAIHVPGGDESAIEQAIAHSGRDPLTLSVPVKVLLAGDQLHVTVAASPHAGAGGAVWMCPLASAVAVHVERGENRGQTLTYHNVVRRWVRLGDWNGEDRSFTVPLSDAVQDGADSVAILVQAGTVENPKTMLGAAIEPLRWAQSHQVQ
jgi:hypothetical protein